MLTSASLWKQIRGRELQAQAHQEGSSEHGQRRKGYQRISILHYHVHPSVRNSLPLSAYCSRLTNSVTLMASMSCSAKSSRAMNSWRRSRTYQSSVEETSQPLMLQLQRVESYQYPKKVSTWSFNVLPYLLSALSWWTC